VDLDVLFTYLPQLEEHRRNNARPDSAEMLHLDKLIEFLRTHYASTSEKLKALLEHKEITFDLLRVFFRPNSIVYMDCATSEQPRCLMFDSGQVKTVEKQKRFNMSCRFLTHDGESFGEATTTTCIVEFRGVKKISSLGVYPLEYHAAQQEIVEELTERGRKFISLIGTHCRVYKGMGFYMKENKEVKKFPVNGRVMIDAVSFRERNPNYFNPRVEQKSSQNGSIPLFSSLGWEVNYEENSESEGKITKREISYSTEDLLLCKPTVFGFSLTAKHWG
jgi:hypothetical protein